MSKLEPYLIRKRAVLEQRQADFQAAPAKAMVPIKAVSWVAGITGARPVKMGEIQFVTDSAPGLAGHAWARRRPKCSWGRWPVAWCTPI